MGKYVQHFNCNTWEEDTKWSISKKKCSAKVISSVTAVIRKYTAAKLISQYRWQWMNFILLNWLTCCWPSGLFQLKNNVWNYENFSNAWPRERPLPAHDNTKKEKKKEGNTRLEVVYSMMLYTKLRTGALRLLNEGILKCQLSLPYRILTKSAYGLTATLGNQGSPYTEGWLCHGLRKWGVIIAQTI